LVQVLQAFVQSLIAGPVLQDGEGLGGGLPIGAQEPDAMTVACGVDADADAVERRSGRHARSPGHEGGARAGEPATGKATCMRGAVSLLRQSFGQVKLVMSGPSRKMYPNLRQRPEGSISSKRSRPQL